MPNNADNTFKNRITSLVTNQYFPMSIGLYLNFFVHGMGVIAIAQNMSHLMLRFNTDEAGIAGIIAGMGLGRLVSYVLSGYLSDRFGRKLMIFLGLFFYILFFVGIIIAPTIEIAFAFALLGGIANASFDTGTYPALMEAYPKATGSSVILCKAAISIGQMIYPLIVGFLIVRQLWYGYSLIIPIVIFLISAVVVSTKKFPPLYNETKNQPIEGNQMKSSPKRWLDGTVTVLFGTTSYAMFYAFVIWIPRYSSAFAGMNEVAALKTVTYYSIGSLISVFVSACLLKSKVRHVFVIAVFPFLSATFVLIIYIFPTPIVCNVGAFTVGFTAAGGILQLGISVLSEFFPTSKAKMTGLYMFFGSFANFAIPLITGAISKISIKYIMLFDMSMGVSAGLLGIIMFIRYYKIFIIPKNDIRLGERL